MPGVQRVGDPNTKGGIVTGGVSSVRVNGRPVAVIGKSVTRHYCCGMKKCPPVHCFAFTAGGSGSVRAGSMPISLTGKSDTCGDSRTGGSSNVRAN